MEEELKYSTNDLYLASFLKMRNHKMILEKNKNKVTFIFIKNDDLTKDVTQYLSGEGSCEPLLYSNSIKNLKNLLYNF